jgi:hypothetical protein
VNRESITASVTTIRRRCLCLLLTVPVIGLLGLTGCSTADGTVRHNQTGGRVLVASSSIAFTNPVISTSSENSLRITDANVVRAIGGGSCVTGMIEPLFGYVAPRTAQLLVAAYDATGKLLAEKVDEINANDLVVSRLSPSPRVPYAVFLPWKPSQIAKVTVIEYSGHTHALLGGSHPEKTNGRYANGNFADYLVATIADVPYIDVHFIGKPDTIFNPVGARGRAKSV